MSKEERFHRFVWVNEAFVPGSRYSALPGSVVSPAPVGIQNTMYCPAQLSDTNLLAARATIDAVPGAHAQTSERNESLLALAQRCQADTRLPPATRVTRQAR